MKFNENHEFYKIYYVEYDKMLDEDLLRTFSDLNTLFYYFQQVRNHTQCIIILLEEVKCVVTQNLHYARVQCNDNRNKSQTIASRKYKQRPKKDTSGKNHSYFRTHQIRIKTLTYTEITGTKNFLTHGGCYKKNGPSSSEDIYDKTAAFSGIPLAWVY